MLNNQSNISFLPKDGKGEAHTPCILREQTAASHKPHQTHRSIANTFLYATIRETGDLVNIFTGRRVGEEGGWRGRGGGWRGRGGGWRGRGGGGGGEEEGWRVEWTLTTILAGGCLASGIITIQEVKGLHDHVLTQCHGWCLDEPTSLAKGREGRGKREGRGGEGEEGGREERGKREGGEERGKREGRREGEGGWKRRGERKGGGERGESEGERRGEREEGGGERRAK